MRISQTLTAFLAGFTLLIMTMAGTVHAEEGLEQVRRPVEILKNRIRSLKSAHPSSELVGAGPVKTFTVLPSACTRIAGIDRVRPFGGRTDLQINNDSGVNTASLWMGWDTILIGEPGRVVEENLVAQSRHCALNLPEGSQILSVKIFAKAGVTSAVEAVLYETISGIFQDPLDNTTDGCSVGVEAADGHDPSQTAYSSPCSMTVKDGRAYPLLLFMMKGAGEVGESTVMQSIQIQYRLPRFGMATPTRAGSAN